MDQKDFLRKATVLFTADSSAGGFLNSQRMFSESSRDAFLGHMWELFKPEEVAENSDFTSVAFVLAMIDVQRKYLSMQERAEHLPEALAKRLVKEKK